jgi:Ca-activated chloride channel family protein
MGHEGGSMTFMRTDYLAIALVAWLAVVVLSEFYVRKYSDFIHKNWLLKQTRRSFFSRLLSYCAFALLLLSAGDLRGREELIKSEIGEQKTIIMIDTSASMLAEDIRPNRFKKALLVARHFVKNAVGHQIAVVVFSDNQKRLVPFTSDIDLLDSRLGGLEQLNLSNGGSSISHAVKESIQYFKTESKAGADYSGNILLITDSEETDGGLDIVGDDKISLAAIGVGTVRGAPIPIRDRHGIFRGYKKFNGTEVESKLDEAFLKRLGDKFKNYRYWVATSYSMPTEEILNFFSKTHNDRYSNGEVRIRHVEGYRLIIWAIVLYILSVLFSRGRSFIPSAMTILLLLPAMGRAQDEQEKLPPLSPEVVESLEQMQKGKTTLSEKLWLGTELAKLQRSNEASVLLSEVAKVDKDNPHAHFNFGGALLAAKIPKAALREFARLSLESEISNEQREDLRKNVLLAITSSAQENEGKGKDKDKKESKGDGDKKDKSSGQGNSKDPNEKNQGEDKKDKSEEKDKNDNKENGKDSENQPPSKEELDKQRQQSQTSKKSKLQKDKLPGLFKQILSDDRALQGKYIDSSTQDKSGSKKDW